MARSSWPESASCSSSRCRWPSSATGPAGIGWPRRRLTQLTRPMKNAVRVTMLARLLTAGCLALLAVPAAANAGTAHLEPRAGSVEELVYDAHPGEANQLTLRYD